MLLVICIALFWWKVMKSMYPVETPYKKYVRELPSRKEDNVQVTVIYTVEKPVLVAYEQISSLFTLLKEVITVNNTFEVIIVLPNYTDFHTEHYIRKKFNKNAQVQIINSNCIGIDGFLKACSIANGRFIIDAEYVSEVIDDVLLQIDDFLMVQQVQPDFPIELNRNHYLKPIATTKDSAASIFGSIHFPWFAWTYEAEIASQRANISLRVHRNKNEPVIDSPFSIILTEFFHILNPYIFSYRIEKE